MCIDRTQNSSTRTPLSHPLCQCIHFSTNNVRTNKSLFPDEAYQLRYFCQPDRFKFCSSTARAAPQWTSRQPCLTRFSKTVHAELYVASSTDLSALEGPLVGDGTFARVRRRAGGKGGFRKQLGKKSREFARARAKEVRAKKKTVASKDTTRPRRENAVVIERSSSSMSSSQTTSIAETLVVRALAAQGVTAALKKFCSRKKCDSMPYLNKKRATPERRFEAWGYQLKSHMHKH